MKRARRYVQRSTPDDGDPHVGTAQMILGYAGDERDADLLIEAASHPPHGKAMQMLRRVMPQYWAIRALGWQVGFQPQTSERALRFLRGCSGGGLWPSHPLDGLAARTCRRALALSPRIEAGATLLLLSHDPGLLPLGREQAQHEYVDWMRRRDLDMKTFLLHPLDWVLAEMD